MIIFAHSHNVSSYFSEKTGMLQSVTVQRLVNSRWSAAKQSNTRFLFQASAELIQINGRDSQNVQHQHRETSIKCCVKFVFKCTVHMHVHTYIM